MQKLKMLQEKGFLYFERIKIQHLNDGGICKALNRLIYHKGEHVQ